VTLRVVRICEPPRAPGVSEGGTTAVEAGLNRERT
jgi:hypothetical protein